MEEVKAGMIVFPSNGGMTPGYLAQPAGEGTHRSVVVIQEWWGLVDHIKEVAERFAGQGYVALAPDLYHGESASEPDEARKLSMALDRARAVEEIAAAVRYLAGMEQVQPKQVGVVGWCMGGGLSLSAAAHNGGIGAVVAFYGRPLEAGDTAKIKAPVMGHYGELDHGIPVSLVRDFEGELKRNDIPHEIYVYEGANHAFFNPTRQQAYHAEAAEEAWRRTLAWFERHLK